MSIPKLMPLKQWCKERFTTPPAYSTALRMVHSGEVPAKKLGGSWYVMAEEEVNSTGSDRVDAILKETH